MSAADSPHSTIRPEASPSPSLTGRTNNTVTIADLCPLPQNPQPHLPTDPTPTGRRSPSGDHPHPTIPHWTTTCTEPPPPSPSPSASPLSISNNHPPAQPTSSRRPPSKPAINPLTRANIPSTQAHHYPTPSPSALPLPSPSTTGHHNLLSLSRTPCLRSPPLQNSPTTSLRSSPIANRPDLQPTQLLTAQHHHSSTSSDSSNSQPEP